MADCHASQLVNDQVPTEHAPQQLVSKCFSGPRYPSGDGAIIESSEFFFFVKLTPDLVDLRLSITPYPRAPELTAPCGSARRESQITVRAINICITTWLIIWLTGGGGEVN